MKSQMLFKLLFKVDVKLTTVKTCLPLIVREVNEVKLNLKTHLEKANLLHFGIHYIKLSKTKSYIVQTIIDSDAILEFND